MGHNFDDDKGNIELTYETYLQDHLNYTQRPFTKTGGAIFFVPNPDNLDGTNTKLPANIPVKNGTIYAVTGIGGIDTDFDFVPDFLTNGRPFNTRQYNRRRVCLGRRRPCRSLRLSLRI